MSDLQSELESLNDQKLPGAVTIEEWCDYWLNDKHHWRADDCNVGDVLPDLKAASEFILRVKAALPRILTALAAHADKPAPPAEPPADAGKMVAVGEGRELTSTQLLADLRWIESQAVKVAATTGADPAPELGQKMDTKFDAIRRICKGQTVGISLRYIRAIIAALEGPTTTAETELTTLREQLAAAEREIPDSLIGWTITAAFADGSFRVQSPIGEVKRVTFFRNEAEAASAKGGA